MIAMPFHPSNTYTIDELKANLYDILDDVEKKAQISLDGKVPYTLKDKVIDGQLYVDQGIIAGCAGGGFQKYPCRQRQISSVVQALELMHLHSVFIRQVLRSIWNLLEMESWQIFLKQVLLLRLHSPAVFWCRRYTCKQCVQHPSYTRNFPNREGSKVQNGQISSVALMDARSIAATAANKGFLTSAEEFTGNYRHQKYFFDKTIYENRIFDSKGVADPSVEIQLDQT